MCIRIHNSARSIQKRKKLYLNYAPVPNSMKSHVNSQRTRHVKVCPHITSPILFLPSVKKPPPQKNGGTHIVVHSQNLLPTPFPPFFPFHVALSGGLIERGFFVHLGIKTGGSLGWKVRGALDAAFEKAAYELEPSTVGNPKFVEVKTGHGYHIIMVEGRR